MKKPYFSIIIPSRDISSQIVDDLLPAINAQLFDKYEVFITPDKIGVTNKKLEEKYPWIQIIVAKENKRPGIKRDACVQRSKGDVLIFIDDDVIPPKYWLQKAHDIFEKDAAIAALGGPGLLPPKVNYWEQVFDATLTTWLGSGSFTYRFQKEPARTVDDFPSMNLMIRKKIFMKAGGFDNGYWPGEDSKLLDKFKERDGGYIYYHPDVEVYHHRRDALLGHLEQYKNYGKMRGLFAAQGDANSIHTIFVIPALFTLYLASLIASFVIIPQLVFILSIPLYFYLALLFYVFLKTSTVTYSVIVGLGAMFVLPLTHLTYGTWYIAGYVREKLN